MTDIIELENTAQLELGERLRPRQAALTTGKPNLANAMTVDVEDYFQVSAFEPQIDRGHWESYPCRVERNIEAILELFDKHDAVATFFTLGWIAKRYPNLIRRIVDHGHELASHGFSHERVQSQGAESFRDDVRRTKAVLEDIGGVAVKGYRAPSFSIGRETLWAFDVLAEEGYQYSSSIYPIRHDHYGMPEAPRFAFRPIPGDPFIEVPITSLSLLGKNLPCGGGGYFRLLPYAMFRWAIHHVNRSESAPCVFYFHPWEIDPDQPRVAGTSLKTRFRHYHNLDRMQDRIAAILQDFRWQRMDEIFLEGKGEIALECLQEAT
jgi:polysaccharide deacetylase family protein (PEP-CTERM system associated)